jgi:hypothetical protein
MDYDIILRSWTSSSAWSPCCGLQIERSSPLWLYPEVRIRKSRSSRPSGPPSPVKPTAPSAMPHCRAAWTLSARALAGTRSPPSTRYRQGSREPAHTQPAYAVKRNTSRTVHRTRGLCLCNNTKTLKTAPLMEIFNRSDLIEHRFLSVSSLFN